MTEDFLRYDMLIEAALREVVRQTLTKVIKNGLLGEHHFYITFQTKFPGVEIPDYLHTQYPDEMTIVLQHQFFGLTVEEAFFSVMLSFNNIRERLVIPFAAITTFADPSVNFALQFQSPQNEEISKASAGEAASGEETPPPAPAEEEKRGEVISLDKFRKK